MDHDTVMNLYSTVFESSKDQSNDAVGAFGLGSKTPFAYTDEFQVTAYLNRTVRFYGCVLGADGTPLVSLLREGETQEPDGIEVRFAVAKNDIETFRDRIRTIAAGFAPCFVCNIDGLQRVRVEERFRSILMTELSSGRGRIARLPRVVAPGSHPVVDARQ